VASVMQTDRQVSHGHDNGIGRDGRGEGDGRQNAPHRSMRLPIPRLSRSPVSRALCLAAPAFLLAVTLTELPATLLNIIYVALGLGFVIFFHELGHFAVAKWCDVHVERFSIGFGPILWARKWGETEYALSAVPFGGYVKMLGQDDMDPSQLTSDEIAQDPRSYSAKPVWQRMAIISAGVTMNILTAVLFFAAAFGLGVTVPKPVAGVAVTGGPAWRAGLRAGDRIDEINGRTAHSFLDIIRGVALSNGMISLKGEHANGERFDVEFEPEKGTRREIGLGPSNAPEIAELEEGMSPIVPGTPASQAKPALKAGDKIAAINGQPVSSYADLIDRLARHRAETVTFDVRRGEGDDKSAERLEIKVGPTKARTLGARVEFERIVAVAEGSPAAEADIRPGDRIIKIDGQDVGRQIDPLQLPYLFGDKAGETVEVELLREPSGGAPEKKTVQLVPLDRPGWTEQPTGPGVPLSIPSIGIAFHLAPRVLSVAPNSPAAKAGLKENDLIKQISLVLPPGAPEEPTSEDAKQLDIPMEETEGNETLRNYAYAFAAIQRYPQRKVLLTVAEGAKKTRVVEIQPWSDPDNTWYVPTRGFILDRLDGVLKADSIGDALALGVDNTRNTVVELYLTLRNLLTFQLSIKELRGPMGISEIAYKMADQGFAELLLFLGILSVNLAVLNFLPIPVLDGGHMVFLVWEAVTRRKPSERVIAAATYAGMLFILGLMATVIYLDLFVHKVFRGG